MQRDYICCRELADGATAYLVKENDDTVSAYAKYPHTASDDIVHELKHIAKVPDNLIDEIEIRPTWHFHMSEHLQEFANSLWNIVQELDPWYVYY